MIFVYDFGQVAFLLHTISYGCRPSLILSTPAAPHPGRGLLVGATDTDTVHTLDPGLVPETGPTETVEPSFLLHLCTLIVDKRGSENEKEVGNPWVAQ